jgi:hypothetical protein
MLEKNSQLPNSENKTSFLFALIQLYNLGTRNINEFYKDKINLGNRMNSQGEMLELFVKDLFSGSYLIKNWEEKEKNWNNYFSYLGSNSLPPDFITRDGIAIEVKKSQKISTIHFNSSYPKKYYPDKEKKINLDTVYIAGTLSKKNDLEMLWFVCGDCLFARNDIYSSKREKLKEYIGSSENNNKQKTTKELGRYNKIDPLGITDLRIRGMYQVKHPRKVFDYLLEDIQLENNKVNCFALVLENKWESFSPKLKSQIEKLTDLTIKKVSIKDPDNPQQRVSAMFIYFGY